MKEKKRSKDESNEPIYSINFEKEKIDMILEQGECTPENINVLTQWINAQPENSQQRLIAIQSAIDAKELALKHHFFWAFENECKQLEASLEENPTRKKSRKVAPLPLPPQKNLFEITLDRLKKNPLNDKDINAIVIALNFLSGNEKDTIINEIFSTNNTDLLNKAQPLIEKHFNNLEPLETLILRASNDKHLKFEDDELLMIDTWLITADAPQSQKEKANIIKNTGNHDLLNCFQKNLVEHGLLPKPQNARILPFQGLSRPTNTPKITLFGGQTHSSNYFKPIQGLPHKIQAAQKTTPKINALDRMIITAKIQEIRKTFNSDERDLLEEAFGDFFESSSDKMKLNILEICAEDPDKGIDIALTPKIYNWATISDMPIEHILTKPRYLLIEVVENFVDRWIGSAGNTQDRERRIELAKKNNALPENNHYDASITITY